MTFLRTRLLSNSTLQSKTIGRRRSVARVGTLMWVDTIPQNSYSVEYGTIKENYHYSSLFPSAGRVRHASPHNRHAREHVSPQERLST
jgi:hypothetical protein